MRSHIIALLLSFGAAVAGCATAPPSQYGPALQANAAGYSETQIENDRYRVSYRARSGGGARANDLALLRASELTLQRGFDWFAVTQRGTEAEQGGSSGPRVSIGTGIGNYGRNSGVSIGAGVGFNLGGGNANSGAATVTLEIRLGHGPKPDDVAAYDAREVERSIRPRL